MIDVEQELRDALQAYASSVTPVQPQRADMARIESLVVRQPSSRPRRARLFGVAAALLLVIGGVATWGVLRRQPKTVLTPTTEVVEPLPIGTWETVLRVWALDVAQAAWVPVEPISITDGIPRSRFVAEADQFVTWNPVPTSDGFVLWDGLADGWRYSIVTGWTKLPTLAVPGLGSDSAVAWVSGHLVAIASVKVHDSVTADNTDHIAIATLDADRWSTMQLVADGWVFKPSPIVVDERMVVLNGPRPEPLLVDPTASHAGAMTGYPIDTVLDQGAAWSGTEFFVWGGQTPMNSSSSTTDDSSTLSNKGAIWRP